jgi:glycerophosphoryl diester phosphodiesterase
MNPDTWHSPASSVTRRRFLKTMAGSMLVAASSRWLHAAPADGLPARGLCAHRGASGTHPENTLPAFEEAIRLGAHMIEFDLHLTRDRVLVLMHDATVDRTTDGKGAVSSLSLEEIRRLDAGKKKDPRFAGTKVPTFAEALAMMPRNVWLNCDIKGGEEIGAAVARAVLEAGRERQAFLSTRTLDAAKGARAVNPDFLICNLVRAAKVKDHVDQTIAMKADFIQLVRDYGLPKEEIARLKSHHVSVNYFYADSEEEVRQQFQAGVDFPLVNYPGRFMPVAQEFGIEPLQPKF